MTQAKGRICNTTIELPSLVQIVALFGKMQRLIN